MCDFTSRGPRRAFFESSIAPFVIFLGAVLAVWLVEPILQFFGL